YNQFFYLVPKKAQGPNVNNLHDVFCRRVSQQEFAGRGLYYNFSQIRVYLLLIRNAVSLSFGPQALYNVHTYLPPHENTLSFFMLHSSLTDKIMYALFPLGKSYDEIEQF